MFAGKRTRSLALVVLLCCSLALSETKVTSFAKGKKLVKLKKTPSARERAFASRPTPTVAAREEEDDASTYAYYAEDDNLDAEEDESDADSDDEDDDDESDEDDDTAGFEDDDFKSDDEDDGDYEDDDESENESSHYLGRKQQHTAMRKQPQGKRQRRGHRRTLQLVDERETQTAPGEGESGGLRATVPLALAALSLLASFAVVVAMIRKIFSVESSSASKHSAHMDAETETEMERSPFTSAATESMPAV